MPLNYTLTVFTSDGPDDMDWRDYQFSPPHQPHWGEEFATFKDAMSAVADTIEWGLTHLNGDFAIEYGMTDDGAQSLVHLHIVHTPNLTEGN